MEKNNNYKTSFTGDYYSTGEFCRKIPDEAKTKILDLLKELIESENDLDYLQVFKLSAEEVEGKKVQVIQHSQEVPEYSNAISYDTENAVTEKVYIISNANFEAKNNEVVTFLLATEY